MEKLLIHIYTDKFSINYEKKLLNNIYQDKRQQ